jgi:hypothetical protein
MPDYRLIPSIPWLISGVALLGCGSQGSPRAEPTPVVFEDRLVISDTDDKAPLRIPPAQLPPQGDVASGFLAAPFESNPGSGTVLKSSPRHLQQAGSSTVPAKTHASCMCAW